MLAAALDGNGDGNRRELWRTSANHGGLETCDDDTGRAETSGLANHYGASLRGFESLSLRQSSALISMRWAFSVPQAHMPWERL